MTKDQNDELEFPVQKGTESVQDDSQSISSGNDSVIHPRYDSKEIFKTVVEKIYSSKEASVREPLSNSVTACLRAEQIYNIDPLIEVTLITQSSGDRKLEILDNGVGMSEDLIRKVLRWIGKSTARNEGTLSGNFGLGFMACYMLVGAENAFEMHTHSRRDGDDPVSGVWQKYGKFEFDNEEILAGRMSENEYGTKLVFPGIKSDISNSQIYQWVRRHSKWSRVPVIFKHIDDGDLIIDEEYGRQTIEDSYDDNATSFVFENKYYKVVASPEASNRTILLDSEIESSAGHFSRVPWSVDVRLKREDGVIISGPNEGLVPVENESELEFTEDVILVDDIDSEDIRMPKPTGTRDTLSNHSPKFWDQVQSNILEELEEIASSALANINSVSDVAKLNNDELEFISHIASRNSSEISTRLDDYNITISQDLANELTLLSEDVKIITRDSSISHGVDIPFQTKSRNVSEILNNYSGSSVYMTVSPSQARADVVWEDSEENILVYLNSQSQYEKFESLGWRKLTSVTSKTVSEFDVSEETATQLRQFDGKSDKGETKISDRDITITTRSITKTGDNTPVLDRTTITAGEVKSNSEIIQDIEKFVLFAPSTDAMISDNYWVANKKVAAINCNQTIYNYLIDEPNVVDSDDYINKDSSDIELTTQKGIFTITHAANESPVILHVSDDVELVNKFKDSQFLKTIDDSIKTFSDEFEVDSVLYAPVSEHTLLQLVPIVRNLNDVYIVDDSHKAIGSSSEIKKVYTDDKMIDMYMSATLDNFEGTELYDWLNDVNLDLEDDSQKKLLEYIEIANQDNISFGSLNDDNNEIIVWTADGMKSAQDVVESSNALVHVVSSDSVNIFEDSELEKRFIDYIINHATASGWSINKIDFDDPSEYTYIPASPSKTKEICDSFDDITVIYGDRAFTHGSPTVYSIPSDAQMYMYARFEDWQDDEIYKAIQPEILETPTTKQLIAALEHAYEKQK